MGSHSQQLCRHVSNTDGHNTSMKFLRLSLSLSLLVSVSVSMGEEKVYHNQFAVELAGGDDLAEVVALRHGLLNMGKVGELKGHYLFQAQHIQKRSAEPCQDTRAKLESDPSVLWFEQQQELSRKKRGGEL